MKKRTLATVLWFYVGWYAGAFGAELLGVTSLLGPAVGLGIATFVAIDPARLIWTRPAEVRMAGQEHATEGLPKAV